jgi:serine protease Do
VILSARNSGERHGIRVQPLTPALASHFSFKGNGVLVSGVIPGSTSETSGIKAGDIITKVNSKEIRAVQEFEEAFDVIKEGTSVRVSLFRDGKIKEVNLPLKP